MLSASLLQDLKELFCHGALSHVNEQCMQATPGQRILLVSIALNPLKEDKLAPLNVTLTPVAVLFERGLLQGEKNSSLPPSVADFLENLELKGAVVHVFPLDDGEIG